MTHTFNLLRGTCLFCHRFRLPDAQLSIYVAKLRLLDYGLVQEADDIGEETLMGQSNFAESSDAQLSNAQSNGADAADGDGQIEVKALAGAAMETPEEFRKRIDGIVGTHIYHATRRGVRRGQVKGQLAYAARRAVIAEFLKAIMTQKRCRHCNAINPTLRKDGFIKIVESELSPKDSALHAVHGIVRPNVLLADSARTNFEDADAVVSERRATVDKEALKDARSQSKQSGTKTRVMPPVECRANLRLLFQRESTLCSLIFGRRGAFESGRSQDFVRNAASGPSSAPENSSHATANGASADAFFMSAISVAPTRFRPASVMGDQTFENAQNSLLTKILNSSARVRELNLILEELSRKVAQPEEANGAGIDHDALISAQKEMITKRRAGFDQLLGAMFQMQVDVNSFIDSTKNPSPESQGRLNPPGVKQALEKKEGLFRKHMMGKRVNFAARSVISPDVNIETNEIGVPPVFAKKLTFPEPVTAENVHLMRQLVINGPDVHPGAVAVRAEDGTETLLGKLTVEQRTALANQLLTPQEGRQAKGTFAGLGSSTRTLTANKQVLRHLRDGDILLLNRQPTLHKPSMMAHRAKVLQGEKTIRMHYANCNSYNADFDGDEMNMHFPQSQAARAECYNLANTDNQFLVPTSGKPLRGLIQDHVVAAVWMTCKNTLLRREEYQQLLYGALRTEDDYLATSNDRILTLPPAILRPQPRWTGKQVISTILLNLKPPQAAGLNATSKAKVAGRYWGKDHAGEQNVIFDDGELLSGVLDKSQIGATAFGVVHAVFELYGAESAGKLLSILSRLLTKWLQHSAFTCRMDDLILSSAGDEERRQILEAGKGGGKTAALANVGLADKPEDDPDTDHNLRIRLEEVIRDDAKLAALDSAMMSASNKLTSSIIDACIPNGLQKVFPENNMQMMTVSGAKGSPVNVSQISCLLGPQALEGRRVPVMVSGKTLPSFKAFDTSMRSGGFVAGRFLTGIRPQEYYFHCMAGREGLIDTAVKTASSGYLQRCLIKHLEGYRVHYDSSVRNSDGSVLQFNYGEDGLDTVKSKYLDQFDFTAANFATFVSRYNPRQLAQTFKAEDSEMVKKHLKKALSKPNKYAPVMSLYNPARFLGSMSESFAKDIEDFVQTNASGLLKTKASKKSSKKRKHENIEQESDSPVTAVTKLQSSKAPLDPERFRALVSVLYLRSLIDPGEAVGLLAAQGVGEPSTQMTLNTFHFAGHGAANVTLGIPRLREIVMTASQKIRTPIMHLPVLDHITDEQMVTFCKDGSRLLLSQVVESAVVTEKMSGKTIESDFSRRKTYVLRLNFYPIAECLEEYNVTLEAIFEAIQETFVPILEQEIVKELKRLQRDRVRQAQAIGKGESFNDAAASAVEAEADAEGGEGGATVAKTNAAKTSKASVAAKESQAQHADDSDSDDGANSDEENNDGDADDLKRKQNSGVKASYDVAGDDDSSDDDDIPDTAESIDAAFNKSDNKSSKEEGKRRSTGLYEGDSDMSDDEALDVEGPHKGLIDEDIDDKVRNLEVNLQSSSKFVTSFSFDKHKGNWAELQLQLGGNEEKLLLMNVVERACRVAVVHQIPNISRVLIPPPAPGSNKRMFTAEGINFRGIWEFAHGIVDFDKLYTNDVGALLHTYGVEAARAAIVAEMGGIFGTYGIDVSMRHLYLIADYQTADGGFKPFNRQGISTNPSPLLKASFEMTMAFLGGAALHGEHDPLDGPSSKLVVGRPVPVGTGTMEVRLPVPADACAPLPTATAVPVA